MDKQQLMEMESEAFARGGFQAVIDLRDELNGAPIIDDWRDHPPNCACPDCDGESSRHAVGKETPMPELSALIEELDELKDRLADTWQNISNHEICPYCDGAKWQTTRQVAIVEPGQTAVTLTLLTCFNACSPELLSVTIEPIKALKDLRSGQIVCPDCNGLAFRFNPGKPKDNWCYTCEGEGIVEDDNESK